MLSRHLQKLLRGLAYYSLPLAPRRSTDGIRRVREMKRNGECAQRADHLRASEGFAATFTAASARTYRRIYARWRRRRPPRGQRSVEESRPSSTRKADCPALRVRVKSSADEGGTNTYSFDRRYKAKCLPKACSKSPTRRRDGDGSASS